MGIFRGFMGIFHRVLWDFMGFFGISLGVLGILGISLEKCTGFYRSDLSIYSSIFSEDRLSNGKRSSNLLSFQQDIKLLMTHHGVGMMKYSLLEVNPLFDKHM